MSRISSIIGRSGCNFKNVNDTLYILGEQLGIDWMKSLEDILRTDVVGQEEYTLEQIIIYVLKNGRFLIDQVYNLTSERYTVQEIYDQISSLENENISFSKEMCFLRRNIIKIIVQTHYEAIESLNEFGLFIYWLDNMLEILQKRNASHTLPLLEENERMNVSSEESDIAIFLGQFIEKNGWEKIPLGEREEVILCLCQHFYSRKELAKACEYLIKAGEVGVQSPLVYYNYFIIASTMGDLEVAIQGYKIAVETYPELSLTPKQYVIEGVYEKNRFYTGFFGYDNVYNRRVVVKVLHDPPLTILNNIKKACEIDDESVIQVYEVNEAKEKRPCIVMEYFENSTIEDYIIDQGRLSGEEFLPAFKQLVSIVANAHNKGIVHGNLTPCKVMILEDGIKILDFGLTPLAHWKIPITNEEMAYLCYMAPELFMRDSKPTMASDVYSLGMIGYYIFTGTFPHPFSENKLPANILPAIKKAIEMDPNKRFRTATKFLTDLENLDEAAVVETPVEKSHQMTPDNIIDLKEEPDVKIEDDSEKNRTLNLPEGEFLLPKNMIWRDSVVHCKTDNSQMVLIPSGQFSMGSEERPTENPVHDVFLDNYLIDIYPVTNAQYSKFLNYMKATNNHSKCHPEEPKNKDHTPKSWQTDEYRKYSNEENCPVVFIDWWDAWAYTSWADKQLPSEAQWEKAARGSDGRKYPWGSEDVNEKLANYTNNFGYTTQVGLFPKGQSPYGCMDMAGNVWEWCMDTYERNFYRECPNNNPVCLTSKPARSLRGGSWNDGRASLRVTARGCWINIVRYSYIGFRCVYALNKQ